MHSLFFCGFEETNENQHIVDACRQFSDEKSIQLYLLNAPLGSEAESLYDYSGAIVFLTPKHKICFLNLEADNERFLDFCEDFIEDLGYLSDKYEYKSQLGRPRTWKERLITRMNISEVNCVQDIVDKTYLDGMMEQRNADFLISLLIGSINDIDRVGGDNPETILDQVKKKIILFDGDQSRFIYSSASRQKRITIQGLAGTGKTELLLHKLKDIYTKDKTARIAFTCYNKTLAISMRKRIPDFFNFMRVDEQIKWEERLWVMPSWGSSGEPNTGLYSFVCKKYGLEFHPYSYLWSFEDACAAAVNELKHKESYEKCFDYVLIDESQDFEQSFFDLCELVTEQTLYIAGDIFQDIYDRTINSSIKSDFLLNKCYRTDPKTLMFAHAVGMGLYEEPVIRWLDDDGWLACGYTLNRIDGSVELSRVPLRRFEDLDMYGIQSIEVLKSSEDDMASKVFQTIDSIRQQHATVQARDIAIVFLEGHNQNNYKLADYLSAKIPEKYSWKAVKGYEVKDSTGDAVFISNRNNIKGLEFPFVICIVSGGISDNVFLRNTIYMMLTRSFITSYLIVNSINDAFIAKYTVAAERIGESGKMFLREPSDEEKAQQNQKVSIAINAKQRTIREIVEDVLKEYPDLSTQARKHILDAMISFVGEGGKIADSDLQERTRKMISALT